MSRSDDVGDREEPAGRTSWRRARACSGLTSRLILAYVEREGGRPAVDELLGRLGHSPAEAELRDENSWFSFDTKIRLWDAAVAVTRDKRIAAHVGEAALEFSIGLGLKRALRALGSPEFVYRNVPRANTKFNWAHELRPVVSEVGHVRLAYRDIAGVGYHHYDCEYTSALLGTVPQLFGLPPARVSHQFCGARGADHCEFDVQWGGGVPTATRPIILAGSAGVLFAATGAVFDPLLLGTGAGLAGAAACIAGIRAAIFTRRRVTALETRARDQDLQAERKLASLAALSSELRLEDVLERITTSASSAVGGAQFALLIGDAESMRAEHHSGLSPDSLWRLERWAEESGSRLSDGPIVIDDLAVVPSLAELFLPQDVRALEIYASHAAIARGRRGPADRPGQQAQL